MRRTVAALTVVLSSALTLTACGGGSSTATQKGASLPTKVIHITIKGSDTDPSGSKIDVAVGQKIEFDVTADKPGEIHVHSSPQEQEFEYKAGSNTFDVKPIEAPGQTTVESHTLDKVLFFLVAR
jgi:hypothetical protein